jgi:hypothetical protein
MASVDADVLRAIAAGPMDAADALVPTELARLLEPGDLPGETGWCSMPDGVGYAAVRTPMPGSGEPIPQGPLASRPCRTPQESAIVTVVVAEGAFPCGEADAPPRLLSDVRVRMA